MEMSDSEWAAHRGRTTSTAGVKPAGLLERLKGGVSSRINEKTADFNQRINDPGAWREKQHNIKIANDSKRVKELQLETKLARLEASKARSQASSRKYAPAPSYGGDAPPLFDMGSGVGGGGDLFDLSGGFGGSSKGGKKNEVPLFDFGMGGPAPKKHKKNKKAKKNNGGIHIHINK
jgi:hypothetical protein